MTVGINKLNRGFVVLNAKRTKKINEVKDEFLAIDTALSRLNAGDLCLILIDQVEEALAHIQLRVSELSS